MGKIKIEGYVCERCGHKWVARNENIPVVCPKCFPGDMVVSGAYKRISEFAAGESVFGFSGELGSTKEVFSHDWNGELVEIRAAGCLPIRATPEHKIFRVHCIQISRSKKRKFSRKFLNPELIDAVYLKKSPVSENKNDCGDYLIIPKIKSTFSGKKIPLIKFTTSHGLKVLEGKHLKGYLPLNKDVAWMFGLYVAEGFSTSEKGDVCFCLGKHEEKLAEKIVRIGLSLGLKTRIVEVETANLVHLSSRIYSRAFREWFGISAKTKQIPSFIMLHADKRIYESFMKGYLEGDGCWGISDGRARVNASTVSEKLALQLQLLSVKMGDFFNITKVDFSKYKSNFKGRTICGGAGFLLRASAGKLSSLVGLKNIPRHNKSYKIFKEHIAVPIKSIKMVNYSGKVFNIQTEEGNYLVNNIAVKNCKSPYWNAKRKKRGKF